MLRTSALKIDHQFLAHSRRHDISLTPEKKILLIEDSKSDVFLIKRMLHEVEGNERFIFTDVPSMCDAIELIGKNSFDLIMLDLNLLDIEGTASVAALHAEAPNTPIIVHSGTDNPKQKEESLICGAQHYLVKGKESPYSLKFIIQDTLTMPQL